MQKKLNAEAALYIELTARQKLADELDNERRYSGMSPREADIQRRMMGTGMEEGTQAWHNLHDEILGAMEAQDTFFIGAKTGFDEIRAQANDFASSSKALVTDLYGGMEDAFVSFAKTGKLDFASLIDTMIEDLARLSYKLATSGLLNMLGGGSPTDTSGYGGILGSLFKSPSLYSAKGDIFSSPTAYSYGGGKTGVMGEDGPEAVVPLRRGRDGKLGIAGGSGGSNVTVLPTVYNNSSKVSARTEVEDRNGQIDIKTYIEDVAINAMASHKGTSLMSALYGVKQQRRSR